MNYKQNNKNYIFTTTTNEQNLKQQIKQTAITTNSTFTKIK